MAADATGIREYKGAAKSTTIVAGINNASTSFSIADSTGWPTGAVGNFVATLEQGLSTEERILCSALAGGVLTVVTRGYDNTTATAHTAGASIAHTISAIDIAEGNYIANFKSAPSKATPVDADVVPLNDSAASNILKSLSWANIKATLLAFFFGYATTATAAGTTTLTVSSARQQFFTGATTQTLVLPVASTLTLGQSFIVENNSTGVVTVQSSGLNTIASLPSGARAIFTCILTSGTTAASWDFVFEASFGIASAVGDILYASAAKTPARLPAGALNTVLTSGGAGVAPSWVAPSAAIPSAYGCSVYASAALNTTLNTDTIIAFNTSNFDTSSYHSNVTNNSRITIPANLGGKYHITGHVRCATASLAYIVLYKNGVQVAQGLVVGRIGGANNTGATVAETSASFDIALVATDYIEMAVYSDAATGSNLTAANFSAMLIGA